MDANELLDLFDHLAARVATALGALGDWGVSGQRATQYNHDVVADEIFLAGLDAAGLAVLSEESGLQGDGAVTAIVDPVDGSTNASRGLPWYAASVAAVDAEGPLASLVVNLATGVRYRAIRGHGAYRDQSPIVVGSDSGGGGTGEKFGAGLRIRPAPTTDLGNAIVAMSGRPRAWGGWAQYRCQGAAALDLCCVADGRLDSYFDVNAAHGVWDYAGALLICSEAGAPMVAAGGLDLLVLDPEQRRGPVAAATPKLLAQIEAMLADWKSLDA